MTRPACPSTKRQETHFETNLQHIHYNVSNRKVTSNISKQGKHTAIYRRSQYKMRLFTPRNATFRIAKDRVCISTHRKRRQQRRSSVGTKTASVTDKYRPKTVKTPHPIAHISTNRRKSKNISKLRLHTIFDIFTPDNMFFTGDGRQNVKAKHNMSAQNAFYLPNDNHSEHTCQAKNKHKNILYSDIFYTFAQDKKLHSWNT